MDFAEFCECSFRTDGTCSSAQQHLPPPHGLSGYGHFEFSAPLYRPFPVPICAGYPAYGEYRYIHLLLYSSRLPPYRFASKGKHRLYEVSILFLLHSQRLCSHYITNQNANPPSFGFYSTIYAMLLCFSSASFFLINPCPGNSSFGKI